MMKLRLASPVALWWILPALLISRAFAKMASDIVDRCDDDPARAHRL